jgi:hypothetical protein
VKFPGSEKVALLAELQRQILSYAAHRLGESVQATEDWRFNGPMKMKARRCLPILLLLGVATMASASQRVRFASDRASAPLPESFRVVVTGDDLVATFGPEKDHKLEISLLAALDGKGGTKNLALLFITEQAQKRGAKVNSDGERAVFSEAGEQWKEGGKILQAMHWQLGVGNCVFNITLAAPLPMSKELDAFLGEPLNELVNGMACKQK